MSVINTTVSATPWGWAAVRMFSANHGFITGNSGCPQTPNGRLAGVVPDMAAAAELDHCNATNPGPQQRRLSRTDQRSDGLNLRLRAVMYLCMFLLEI